VRLLILASGDDSGFVPSKSFFGSRWPVTSYSGVSIDTSRALTFTDLSIEDLSDRVNLLLHAFFTS
jgi:predicted TIM-barrel fold metal-dependent hydrolase